MPAASYTAAVATADYSDVADLSAAYHAQLRGRVPDPVPTGAVVERDGPVVGVHYGTHGTVDCTDLAGVQLSELVARQQARFAERGEPVEWRVYPDDAAPIAQRLIAAGFTPGWARSILAVDMRAVVPPAVGRYGAARGGTALPAGHRVRDLYPGEHSFWSEVRRLSAATGPHRSPFADLEEDGRLLAWDLVRTRLIEADGRVRDAGWAEIVKRTEFLAIGGVTGHYDVLVPALLGFGYRRADYVEGRQHLVRYAIAEADGSLSGVLTGLGFRAIATVQSYHWAPPGTPAATRPVSRESDDIWERFTARFDFQPWTGPPPVIAEPDASVTWLPDAADDGSGTSVAGRLQRIVERGLRACAVPGERLYWLDWQHLGYQFDPHRVGGIGQPPWPGRTDPAYSYVAYLAPDARFGTFGDPTENSLCVFGEQLLAEIEDDLVALLGTGLRRGGRNVDNAWTFGPDDQTSRRRG